MTDYPVRNENRLAKGELAPGEITLPRPGRIATIVAIVFVFAFIVLGMAGYVEKWLWMRQLDYVEIFWTVLSVEYAMGILAFAVVFGFLWLNLRQAVKGTAASLRAARPQGAAPSTANDGDTEDVIKLIPLVLKGAFAIVSAGIALLFAVALFAQWDTYLRFRYGKSFGVADPLYGVDVGFYVFHLPFYEMLQRVLLVLLLSTLAIVVGNYVLTGALSPNRRSHPAAGDHAASHISVLMALLAADFGWGFYLGHYELLYSTMGVVYGAGFTAANVTRWALWGMVALSAAACALCAVNMFRQGAVGLKTVAAVYVTAWIIGIYLRSRVVSEIHRPTQRTGDGKTLPHQLHRRHEERLSTGYDQGDFLSRPGGSHARGDGEESGYDPEHPFVGLTAVVADLRADPGDPPVLQLL